MALNKVRLKNSIKANIEAITNFPQNGMSPIIQDDRVLQAIADAIVDEIVGNAEVLPDTLNNPAGQPVHVSIISGDGVTTAPQVIQGEGKVI